MDNPIRRPKGLYPLLAGLLSGNVAMLTEALRRVQIAQGSGEGRNDRRAQRAGEIQPHGYSRAGAKVPSKRDRHRMAVAALKSPPPEPKFPKERKRRGRQGIVRITRHRLVIPR